MKYLRLSALPGDVVETVRRYPVETLFCLAEYVLLIACLEKQELMDAMHAQPVQPESLAEALRKFECNYLVYPAADGLMEAMEEEEFELLGVVGNYQIYKDVKA